MSHFDFIEQLPRIKFTTFCKERNFSLCHQYFFIPIVLLDALQLAAGATGLFSQEVTTVVHGCSIHALGHSLGEETGFTTATLQEGSENARHHTRLHS